MQYMFLPFRRYADFQGRSRRLEFWLFVLLNVIVSFVSTIVFVALFFGVLVDLARRYGAYATGYDAFGLEAFGMGWNVEIPPDVLLAEIGPLGIAMLGAICLYTVIVFIPGLAVAIRRLHDSNRTGWWVLLPYAFYPFMIGCGAAAVAVPALAILFGGLAVLFGLFATIGALVLLVFMFLEGTRGPNRFGPDPKPYAGPPRGW